MRRVLGMLTVFALLAGACTGDTDGRDRRLGSAASGPGTAASLLTFDDCDAYLDHVVGRALELVDPWGLGEDDARSAARRTDANAHDADSGTGIGAGTAPEADRSGTNVQEEGIDEPDVIKTDGSTVYLVAHDALQVIDATADAPVVLASIGLRTSYDAQLLLHDEMLLVTRTGGPVIPFAGEELTGTAPFPGGMDRTTITAIDVSDPAVPVVSERLTLTGSMLSSRLVDGTVRIVIRTDAGAHISWAAPRATAPYPERMSLDTNRQLIRDSTYEDWIPSYVHANAEGETTEGPLLPCERIARPEVFSGLGLLSVLTVDLDGDGLGPGAEVAAVLASGDTVYASHEKLYVATSRWVDWEEVPDRDRWMTEVTTEIHAFDLASSPRAEYLASGTVPGYLPSRWAMSEHEGRLRVVSTIGEVRPDLGMPSESSMTVLEPQGAELVTLGQVTGLGSNERVHAVRYLGDLGHVITSRVVDPLYILDLSDPTQPEVAGKLRVPGYSAYLHPVGDDLLLGVGQDAPGDGGLADAQLSLFDVSRPADPQRIDQLTIAQSSSDVELDHRAFLHWPAIGLTVVPFRRDYDWDDPATTKPEGPPSGAVVVTTTRDDGITERGVVSQTASYLRDVGLEPVGDRGPGAWDPRKDPMWKWAYETSILRSVVIGDRLLTISQFGIAVHDLDTLAERGWLTLAAQSERGTSAAVDSPMGG
jgi:uncharacterized secreted protein with C-terminal beta-propeller domain